MVWIELYMISILGINFQLSSCSMDNTVGIVTGVNFDHTLMIRHDNLSGFRYEFLQIIKC